MPLWWQNILHEPTENAYLLNFSPAHLPPIILLSLTWKSHQILTSFFLTPLYPCFHLTFPAILPLSHAIKFSYFFILPLLSSFISPLYYHLSPPSFSLSLLISPSRPVGSGNPCCESKSLLRPLCGREEGTRDPIEEDQQLLPQG